MKLKINQFSRYLIDPSLSSSLKNFTKGRSIYLDIGCGDGEFVTELAEKYPKKYFVGIEIKYGRIIKCLKKAKLNKNHNLRYMLADASIMLNQIIPPNSINKIFINNPDPWPKEKHEKNRILNSMFFTVLHKALKRRGFLYIKTDDRGYKSFIEKQISKSQFKKNNNLTRFDKSLPLTKFQKLYLNNNKRIYSFKLEKL
tara:strand:- start:3738 stop:4334 length:597 start_codon:yes stop_codon:yes gene_type:complete